MVQQSSTVTLSSLYSSGQCLLSVLGSIGVILLFAGIPQLIYSTPVNPGSLMTFLLGAILICLMVAGNAFIGYKYRQLVRNRREVTRTQTDVHRGTSSEDKPPSYDDLLAEDGMPPEYASIIIGKPPKYEDLVAEVINWPTIAKVRETNHVPIHPSASAPSGFTDELPVIAPLYRNQSQNFNTSKIILPRVNLGFQSSTENLSLSSSQSPDFYKIPHNTNTLKASSSKKPQLQRSISYASPFPNLPSFSPSIRLKFPSVHIVNEKPSSNNAQSTSNSQQKPEVHPSSSESENSSQNKDNSEPSSSRL